LNDSTYALVATPFAAEALAIEHLDTMRAQLLWLALDTGVGLRYAPRNGHVEVFPDPAPVVPGSLFEPLARSAGWSAFDGHYMEGIDEAIARPEHLRLARFAMGQPSVHQEYNPEFLARVLGHVLGFPSPQLVVRDLRLRLAIELYCSTPFEVSARSRLVTMVSALEAVLPEYKVDARTKAALQRAAETVALQLDELPQSSADRVSIDRLLQRVTSLNSESISSSLRRWVREMAEREPALGQADDLVESVGRAYDVRSRLLHTGHASTQHVDDATRFLKKLIPNVLRVSFRDAASAPAMPPREGMDEAGSGGTPQ